MYGPGPTGSVAMLVEVTLYADSGATLCTAGDGWEDVLCLDEDAPPSAMGAGNHKLTPLHSGKADLFFPATAALGRLAPNSGFSWRHVRGFGWCPRETGLLGVSSAIGRRVTAGRSFAPGDF